VTHADEEFQLALGDWRAEPYDGDALDARLSRIVRRDISAAVAVARGRLGDADDDVRGVACQLLAVAAQLGDEDVRADIAGLVIGAYEHEHDSDVLVGIVRALGGTRDGRGLPVLTALAGNPDADIRRQVAADLPMIMDDSPVASGVETLIALSADPEPRVRDWATFGLGTLTDADSEAVRRALWARIDDSCIDARDEAVVALARRRDDGVLPLVADLLAQSTAGTLIFEAAAHLADRSLLPLLRDFDTTDDDVRAAIEACEQRNSMAPPELSVE
jgi:HEAT repeat protein